MALRNRCIPSVVERGTGASAGPLVCAGLGRPLLWAGASLRCCGINCDKRTCKQCASQTLEQFSHTKSPLNPNTAAAAAAIFAFVAPLQELRPSQKKPRLTDVVAVTHRCRGLPSTVTLFWNRRSILAPPRTRKPNHKPSHDRQTYHPNSLVPSTPPGSLTRSWISTAPRPTRRESSPSWIPTSTS
jgi:hypothetical protein